MTTRGLSYRQVRRRRVGALAVVIADVALFCVAVPTLSARVGGAGALALLVAFVAVLLGALVVAVRTRTVAAARAAQTGQVPDLPDPAPLRRELERLRAQYDLLLVAAATAALVPLGALGVVVQVAGVGSLVSWATAVALTVLGVAAFWVRWVWRRRTTLARALAELGGHRPEAT